MNDKENESVITSITIDQLHQPQKPIETNLNHTKNKRESNFPNIDSGRNQVVDPDKSS